MEELWFPCPYSTSLQFADRSSQPTQFDGPPAHNLENGLWPVILLSPNATIQKILWLNKWLILCYFQFGSVTGEIKLQSFKQITDGSLQDVHRQGNPICSYVLGRESILKYRNTFTFMLYTAVCFCVVSYDCYFQLIFHFVFFIWLIGSLGVFPFTNQLLPPTSSLACLLLVKGILQSKLELRFSNLSLQFTRVHFWQFVLVYY